MKIEQVGALVELQSLLLQMVSLVARLQPTPKPRRKRKPRLNAVERFIAAKGYHLPGAVTEFADFKVAFASWLPPEQIDHWTSAKVIKALPVFCAYGRWNGNRCCIGNLSLANVAPDDPTPFGVNESARLAREGANQ